MHYCANALYHCVCAHARTHVGSHSTTHRSKLDEFVVALLINPILTAK